MFVAIPLNSYSKESKFEKRLQKDIKKLSKISGFIDNNSKSYSEDEISDRQKHYRHHLESWTKRWT